jgi:hypothetical protein
MIQLQDLVERDSFINPGVSAALGVTVARKAAGDIGREPLGVIVDVAPGRQSVWVRRFTDDVDVSVSYSLRELELATSQDLVEIARYFLGRQYREVGELRAKVAKENAR